MTTTSSLKEVGRRLDQRRFLLLLPLDIGRSYIFRVDQNGRERIAKELAGKSKVSADKISSSEIFSHAWKEIFATPEGSHDWEFYPLPPGFSNPRGPVTRLNMKLNKEAVLLAKLRALIGLEPETIEATFFPLGIGLVSVSGRLSTSAELALETLSKRGSKLSVEEEIKEIGARFGDILALKAGRSDFLSELEDVRRNPSADVAYSFPIVIVNDEGEYRDLLKRDYRYPGMGEEGKPRREYKYYYSTGDQAHIFVGWTEAYAWTTPTKIHENALKDSFFIGMTSWYALRVMERIASAYLLDAFKDIASTRRRSLKSKSRAMRLTFMDAANASHPIRWTGMPQDLGLLEYINDAWSSLRLRESVEEKTNTLATHHDQLEEEDRERRNGLLALFGGAIACLTMASTVSDITALLPQYGRFCWFKQNDWLLSIILPIMMGILLALWMRLVRSNRKA